MKGEGRGRARTKSEGAGMQICNWSAVSNPEFWFLGLPWSLPLTQGQQYKLFQQSVIPFVLTKIQVCLGEGRTAAGRTAEGRLGWVLALLVSLQRAGMGWLLLCLSTPQKHRFSTFRRGAKKLHVFWTPNDLWWPSSLEGLLVNPLTNLSNTHEHFRKLFDDIY